MAYKNEHHLFPEDCFIEIALKLPIKSILRFRCVSKFWYAFSISSYFINLHMKLNEKSKILFISSFEDKFLSFNLKDESFVNILNPNLKIINLAGYCNGIICFQTDNNNIVLLNPSTREFKVLPSLHDTSTREFKVLLDFPIVIKSIGFYFDDLNNDYKVILILSGVREEDYAFISEVAIYSLRSNAWRKSKNININPLPTISDNLILESSNLFFNGRVHWDSYDSHSGPCIILSMDISNEAFYEFQYPEPILLWKDNYQINLQVIRGSLSVILFHGFNNRQYIDIWSMKEYGVVETWSKQYTLGPLQFEHALSIRDNEDEEDEDLLVLSRRMNEYKEDNNRPLYRWQLVRWNLLKKEQIKKYCLGNFYNNMEVLCYSQSLVSLANNKLDYM